MDPKALKKLADVCRKAGIRHYKSPEFEFTLTDELPSKVVNKASIQTDQEIENEETLTEEEMLLWSVGGGIPITGGNQ